MTRGRMPAAGLLLGLAVFMAGCATAPATSPTPAATPTGIAAPTVTLPASPTPTATVVGTPPAPDAATVTRVP